MIKLNKLTLAGLTIISLVASGTAFANVVSLSPAQENAIVQGQNKNTQLLTEILSTLKQNQISAAEIAKAQMSCVAGDKMYSQGFTLTQEDSLQLRCGNKDGHPQWVPITNFK